MGFKDLIDISELENLCTFNWRLTGSGKTSFIDDCFVLNPLIGTLVKIIQQILNLKLYIVLWKK
jgi:hypothetical protein